MKNKIFSTGLAAGLIFFVGTALAGEYHDWPKKTTSPDLNRIKGLVGVWKGTSVTGKEEQPVTVEYALTSGGSAVVEKLFAGTDHEMISVYHDQKGKLTLTHYCMLGNQPILDLKKSTPEAMQFEFCKKSDINPKKETHMHSLRLTTKDGRTLVQDWTLFEKGKPSGVTTIKLTRAS